MKIFVYQVYQDYILHMKLFIVPEKSASCTSKRPAVCLKPKPSNPENICIYTSSSTVKTRLPETVAILFSYFSTSGNELAF